MNQASFLRLALVLSDGQAMTFKKNLLKLVNLVLFENYGQDLTISEIIKKISEKYSLDFVALLKQGHQQTLYILHIQFLPTNTKNFRVKSSEMHYYRLLSSF